MENNIYDLGFYPSPHKNSSKRNLNASSPHDIQITQSRRQQTNSPSSPMKKKIMGDRFIVSRNSTDINVAQYLLKENSPCKTQESSPTKDIYKQTLARTLFHNNSTPDLILESGPILDAKDSPDNINKLGGDEKYTLNHSHKKILSFTSPISKTNLNDDYIADQTGRTISTTPERILDAPELIDDYYLNLIDWGSKHTLAVALGASIYLWDDITGNTSLLTSLEENQSHFTSVSFSANQQILAAGLNLSTIQLWDTEYSKQIRTINGHSARVSSLSWNDSSILSSGSRDSTILNHDIRIPSSTISTFQNHSHEVCGLKWSPDGSKLASGGNDNVLNIWSLQQPDKPLYSFTNHNAAVKALAWCPWQNNLLASGGGTADRTIKLWNINNGTLLNSVDTKSQVCSIIWSKTLKELVTSHGYSQNQLCVWKYPSMIKQIELTGHSSRVLHMSLSPDGTTVVSAAADETLRFWKIFDNNQSRKLKKSKTDYNLSPKIIR